MANIAESEGSSSCSKRAKVSESDGKQETLCFCSSLMGNLVESKDLCSSSNRAKLRDSNGMPETDETDRISCLPEDVLSHILSFLSTEQAVTTSILSRRWRSLWTLVPKLEFHGLGLSPEENQSFIRFIEERVLALQKSFPAVVLDLICYSIVGEWFEELINPSVQELDLYLDVIKPIRLPQTLFTSKKLVALKLGKGISFNVPTSVHLPCLRILHLDSVESLNDESLTWFLSGCPALEDMHFRGSSRGDIKTLSVCVPTLKSLTIDYFTTNPKDYRLEIKAPALKYLEFHDVFVEQLIVEDLPNLEKASVNLCPPSSGKLLSALQYVKFLSLGSRPHYLQQQLLEFGLLPKFHRLVRLEITVSAGLQGLLPKFLESSPNLCFLNIIKGNYDLSWSAPACVPHCLLYSLRSFCIRGFEGLTEELEMVHYILKNARVLQKARIRSRHLNTGSELLVLEALKQHYPRV